MSAHAVNGFRIDAASIAAALHGKKVGREYQACCPAHDDRNPSLSLTQAGDRTLVHCHGGCSQEAVIEALKDRGLWTPGPSRIEQGGGNKRYVYNDEQGNPLHSTVRKPGKKFHQERYENGRWVQGLSKRTVLYYLDELIAHPDKLLCLAEGEADVDRLRSLGYLATCNPMGAGKWRESYTEAITGRDIVLFYDNDPPEKKFPGQNHALQVALSLLRAKCQVRIVDLPTGKDVSDFLALGYGKADLNKLIENAPYQNKKSVREWRARFESKPADHAIEQPSPKTQQELPWINIANRQLRDKTAESLAALQAANNPPVLYVRSGGIVCTAKDEQGGLVISEIGEDALRNHLTDAANFRRPDPRKVGAWIQVSPPKEVAKSILAMGSEKWGFPPLKAIIEAPTLRPDGTILNTPGYDPATRFYYEPAPGLNVNVPETPTAKEVQEAAEYISDLIGEFPFADEASKANMIAGMLTAVCRPAIAGSTPLLALDATAPGSGKTLLSDLISIVGTGREGALFSAPKQKAEWDKQITTALWGGSPIVVIDNMNARLESDDLCRALTGQIYAARMFHTQKQLNLPVCCSWIATGNNIQVDADTARRCYRVRLVGKQSQPDEEKKFKYPNIKDHAKKHRSELLSALLTMARAWFAAGQPAPDLCLVPSFESWSQVIGGILQYAQIKGFLQNKKEFLDQANPEARQWEAFLLTLREAFYGEPFKVVEVVKKLQDVTYNQETHRTEPSRMAAQLRDVLPDGIAEAVNKEGALKQRMSKAFSERRGTWYGESGAYLADAGHPDKTQRWKVCTRDTDANS